MWCNSEKNSRLGYFWASFWRFFWGVIFHAVLATRAGNAPAAWMMDVPVCRPTRAHHLTGPAAATSAINHNHSPLHQPSVLWPIHTARRDSTPPASRVRVGRCKLALGYCKLHKPRCKLLCSVKMLRIYVVFTFIWNRRVKNVKTNT